jgi:hypothetical protein
MAVSLAPADLVVAPRARLALQRARTVLALWPGLIPIVPAIGWAAGGRAVPFLAAVGIVGSVTVVERISPGLVVQWVRARVLLASWSIVAIGLGLGLRIDPRRSGRRPRTLVPIVLRVRPWVAGPARGRDVVLRLLPGQRAADLDRAAELLQLRTGSAVELVPAGRVWVLRLVDRPA